MYYYYPVTECTLLHYYLLTIPRVYMSLHLYYFIACYLVY